MALLFLNVIYYLNNIKHITELLSYKLPKTIDNKSCLGIIDISKPLAKRGVVLKEYKPRIADKLLKNKLEGKGAVLVEGAKWCGKTTTCEQIAKTKLYLSDPEKQ